MITTVIRYTRKGSTFALVNQILSSHGDSNIFQAYSYEPEHRTGKMLREMKFTRQQDAIDAFEEWVKENMS